MAEIFISYKSERRPAAEHFAEVLKRYGFTVWFDYELVKGKDFAAQIEHEIRGARALVALWCSLSVTSRWVREEVHLAHDLGILVPVKIEACEIPFGFRLADTIDLCAWDGDPRSRALDQLIDALEGRIGRDAVQDRKSLIEYESTWRRFGAHPLKDFKLKKTLEPAETERFGLNQPSPVPNGSSQTPAERDWERHGIERSEDPEEIETYARLYEAGEPLWALKAKKRLAVVNVLLAQRAEAKRQAEARAKAEAEQAERKRTEARRAEIKGKYSRAGKREEIFALWQEDPQAAAARLQELGFLKVPAVKDGKPVGYWLKPGESFPALDGGPEMVIVPAGEFWMGSKDGEGDADERPRHKAVIPKPLAVGRYAVTFAEWDAARAAGGVSHNPSDQGWGRGRRPVINVNWDDAQAYIKWLSGATGQPYRLLSEAEWEYCCRAGTETAYSFGNSIAKAQAQFSASNTAEVGSFPANPFGLHDMHGNVWEWCEDCWHDNYIGAPEDGSAWTTGDGGRRVLRGGSWNYLPEGCRSADRNWFIAGNRYDYRGFRLARTLI